MSRSTDASWGKEDIFEHNTAPVEPVERYVPGGLHPIHLGDSVGHYTILRKLGYGGFSTVWLVQKQDKPGSYFALKVVRADINCAQEIQHYQILQLNSSRHPGRSHIMMLEDYFPLDGPNGKHDCLVYEVLGPSIASVLSDSAGLNTMAYLTLSSARKIIYQILLGLDCMHSVGLVHGDIYAGNVLFTLKDLSLELPELIRQPQSQVSDRVRRVKGPSQPGDPQHLTLDLPLNHFVSTEGNVKLIDLGNSFPKSNPPKKLATPLEYRSPELILSNCISEAQDCWAFACLIYEILTGTPLFDLSFIYDQDLQDDAHMLQLYALLGRLPTQARSHWLRYSTYVNAENQLQKFTVDDMDQCWGSEFDEPNDEDHLSVFEETESPQAEHQQSKALPDISSIRVVMPPESFNPDLHPFLVTVREHKVDISDEQPETLAEFSALYPSLSDRWRVEKNPDMQPAEAEMVLDLLQSMLTYDIDQRPSTEQILAHPWIKTHCAPENDTSNPSQVLPETSISSGKRKRFNAAVQLGTEDDLSGGKRGRQVGSNDK